MKRVYEKPEMVKEIFTNENIITVSGAGIDTSAFSSGENKITINY